MLCLKEVVRAIHPVRVGQDARRQKKHNVCPAPTSRQGPPTHTCVANCAPTLYVACMFVSVSASCPRPQAPPTTYQQRHLCCTQAHNNNTNIKAQTGSSGCHTHNNKETPRPTPTTHTHIAHTCGGSGEQEKSPLPTQPTRPPNKRTRLQCTQCLPRSCSSSPCPRHALASERPVPHSARLASRHTR